MSTAMMDLITLLMIGSKQVVLLLRGLVFAPLFFLCIVVMLADLQADGR